MTGPIPFLHSFFRSFCVGFLLLPPSYGATELRISEVSEFSTAEEGCLTPWLELEHFGASPLDLSGAILCGQDSCSGASESYTFPAGSLLPAASRAVLCQQFTFPLGGLEASIVTLEDPGGQRLATTGWMPGCTVTTSIMSCTDRIFSEFAREQKVSYGRYLDQTGFWRYGFLHPPTPGEENILNCSNGSSGSCSYVPEHIWNVTCADSYSESFEGNEALCLASCSEDSRCNFFWVNENGKCSKFEVCDDVRAVVWAFDGKETRTTTWRKLVGAAPWPSTPVCTSPFWCKGQGADTTSTTTTVDSTTPLAAGISSGSCPHVVLLLFVFVVWAYQ